MKRGTLIPVALLAVAGCGSISMPTRTGEIPLSWCLVREMEPVPETWWTPCAKDAYPADVKRALADWDKKRPWVQAQLTPALARALSRWAQREMEAYQSVPDLRDVALYPVAYKDQGGDHRWLLLEGTVDTLPSHSPGIVTRWLKIYIIYNSESRSVVRATVTIEGQRLE